MEEYDVVVIGARSGGLVVAIGLAKAGKRVLLVERRLYGGDCTNFGCIPSTSLIASANCARAIEESSSFGLSIVGGSSADRVFSRVRDIGGGPIDCEIGQAF